MQVGPDGVGVGRSELATGDFHLSSCAAIMEGAIGKPFGAFGHGGCGGAFPLPLDDGERS